MRYYLKYLEDRLLQDRLYVSEIEKMAGTVAELINAGCEYRLLMFIDTECYDCICISDNIGRFRIVQMSCFCNGLASVLQRYSKDDIQKFEYAYNECNGAIIYDAYYDSQFPELCSFKSSLQEAIVNINLSENPGKPVYVTGGNSNLKSVRYAIQNKVGTVNKVSINTKINLKSKILFSEDIIAKVLHLSVSGISVIQVIKQRYIEVFLPNDDLSKSSFFIDNVVWSDLINSEFDKCGVGNIECIYVRISFEIDVFNNLICKTEDLSGLHKKKLLVKAPFGQPTEHAVKQKPLAGNPTLEQKASEYDDAETRANAQLNLTSEEVSKDTPSSTQHTTSRIETASETSNERLELKPDKFTIQAGEVLTYYDIFGEYLCGAEEMVVTDPYIRLWHQFENFRELIKTCKKVNEENHLAGLKKIQLITTLPEKNQANSKTKEPINAQKAATDNKSTLERLERLKNELHKAGLEFSYEFQPGKHDRSIKLSNGWYISLGRGLDMFEKPENSLEPRKCKETSIEICRTNDIKTVKPKKRNIKR